MSALTAELLTAAEDQVASAGTLELKRALAYSLFDAMICGSVAKHRATTLGGGSGRATGTVTIFGLRQRTTAEDAAGINAILVCSDDQDDVHWPTMIHIGSIVWPTVLAAAEDRGAPIGVAFHAAAVAYEVAVRIARCLDAEQRRTWHGTAAVGAVAAATGAALALELDTADVVTAMGHALSVIGGSAQSVVERSGSLVFHRAHAAQSGLLAASMARAGISSTRFGFEGERGLFASGNIEAQGRELLEIRTSAAVIETSFRLLPGTGFGHSSVVAAMRLMPIDLAMITEVFISVPHRALRFCGTTPPTASDDAWWSIPFCVAATLVNGPHYIRDTAALTDPLVLRLLDRTAVNANVDQPEGDLSAGLRITAGTHGSREAVCTLPPGHVDLNPNEDDLIAKWCELSGSISAIPARAAFAVIVNGAGGESTEHVTRSANAALTGSTWA